MGLSSKKTTTTSSGTENLTTTPQMPAWGVNSLIGLNSNIESLAQNDPEQYVAKADPLQTQAAAGAANLGSTWSAPFAQATGDINDVTSADTPQAQAAHAVAASLLDDGGIAKYLNPELQSVVDTSLADYDKNAGQTLAQLAAKGALNSAFGGSRYGILEGETNADLAQKRGLLDSGLRASAYSDAANQANEDAQRRQSTSEANAGRDTSVSVSNAQQAADALARKLQGAGLLANIGNSADANARADVASQDAAGGVLRDIAQSKATAPLSLTQAVAQLLDQNQLGLLTGSNTQGTTSSTGTTTSDPSLLGGIGQGISAIGDLGKLFGNATPLAGLFKG